MATRKTVNSVGDAIAALGGQTHVKTCLGLDQSTISSWAIRKRVSRDYFPHVFLSLMRRKIPLEAISPRVFGLQSWDSLIIPPARKRTSRRMTESR